MIAMLAAAAVWFGVLQKVNAQIEATSANGQGTSFGLRFINALQARIASVNYLNNIDGNEIDGLMQGDALFAAVDNLEKVFTIPELVSVPFVTDGIVAIVHLPNLPKNITKSLFVTREQLVKIYNGTITSWSDEEILNQNPAYEAYLKNNNYNISVVHREQASGTNYVFTRSLSAFSKDWAEHYGFGLYLDRWPVGKKFSVTSNSDMFKIVGYAAGSIGYLPLSAYVNLSGSIPDMDLYPLGLVNKAGREVVAGTDTISAAIDDVLKDSHEQPLSQHYFNMIDRSCLNCWPLTSFSYFIVKKEYKSSPVATLLNVTLGLKFVHYATSLKGQALAVAAGYVPLPESLQAKTNTTMLNILFDGNTVSFKDPVKWQLIGGGLTFVLGVIAVLIRLLVAFCAPRKRVGPNSRVTVDEFTDPSNTSLMNKILNADPSISGAPVRVEDTLRRAFIDTQEIVIQNQIGKGSFGEVYSGTYTGAVVAIKRILLPANSERTNVASTFIKEAGLMAGIRHPNIVQFLGAAVSYPHLILVTEYCSRGSLYDVLQDPGTSLDRRTKISLLTDAALGIMYLHTQGIVHRDIKTHNLLVDRLGMVKVGDFGTAALTKDVFSSRMKTMCGTPEYVAPEVVSPKSNGYTAKADVYSFAIVMWEVWSGRPLYPNMEMLDILYGVTSAELRPPIEAVDEPRLRVLIVKCWQTDPTHRPAFDEILDVLRDLEEAEEDN